MDATVNAESALWPFGKGNLPGSLADAILASLPAASRRALRRTCRAARDAVDAHISTLSVFACVDALPAAAPRLLRLRELTIDARGLRGAWNANAALSRLPAPPRALGLVAADAARWASPRGEDDLSRLAEVVSGFKPLCRAWLLLSAKASNTGCASLLAGMLRAPGLESLSVSVDVDGSGFCAHGLRLPTQLKRLQLCGREVLHLFGRQLMQPGALPRIADLRVSALDARRVVASGHLGGFDPWSAPCLQQLTRLCLRAWDLPPKATPTAPAALTALEELRVDVDQCWPALEGFAAFALPRLRALAITDQLPREAGPGSVVTRTALAALLSSPQLRSLELRFGPASAALDSLPVSSGLTALTRLALSGPFGYEAAVKLYGSAWAPRLRHFALDVSMPAPRMAEAWQSCVLACERMVRLEALGLRGISFSLGDAWELVAWRAPHLTALTRLDLRQAAGSSGALIDGLAGMHLPRLKCLRLCRAGATAAELRRLAYAPWLGQLSRLQMSCMFNTHHEQVRALRTVEEVIHRRCPAAELGCWRRSSRDTDPEEDGVALLADAQGPPVAHMILRPPPGSVQDD